MTSRKQKEYELYKKAKYFKELLTSLEEEEIISIGSMETVNDILEGNILDCAKDGDILDRDYIDIDIICYSYTTGDTITKDIEDNFNEAVRRVIKTLSLKGITTLYDTKEV